VVVVLLGVVVTLVVVVPVVVLVLVLVVVEEVAVVDVVEVVEVLLQPIKNRLQIMMRAKDRNNNFFITCFQTSL